MEILCFTGRPPEPHCAQKGCYKSIFVCKFYQFNLIYKIIKVYFKLIENLKKNTGRPLEVHKMVVIGFFFYFKLQLPEVLHFELGKLI